MINPRKVSATVLKFHVRDAVRGADTTEEAHDEIMARFRPKPLASVQEEGKHHFMVTFLRHAGIETKNMIEIRCRRRKSQL